jgi:hypothetical protein
MIRTDSSRQACVRQTNGGVGAVAINRGKCRRGDERKREWVWLIEEEEKGVYLDPLKALREMVWGMCFSRRTVEVTHHGGVLRYYCQSRQILCAP